MKGKNENRTSPKKTNLSMLSKRFKGVVMSSKSAPEKVEERLKRQIGVYSNELTSKDEKQEGARDFVSTRLGQSKPQIIKVIRALKICIIRVKLWKK